MKFCVALLVLIVASSQIVESEAWLYRGYGGYGYGRGYGYYGGYYGSGYGYPYYGYSYYGKRDVSAQTSPVSEFSPLSKRGEIANQTVCSFMEEASVLACRAPLDQVGFNCPAIWSYAVVGSVDYLRFGVGPAELEADNSSVEFSLYPRKLDDSAYVSDIVKVEGGEKKVSLYFAAEPNAEFLGLRVTDSACFEKIVKLFESSLRNETVVLESALDIKPVARLIAEIVYVPKSL